MRSMMRPRYPVAKDCFPTTSTWYALPSQVHSVRELFLPFPICQISSRGVFKRKLFAAKKQVSHEFRSHVHGKKLPKFKANPQRLSLNKEDSIWFLHFLFVQIEFLHAHVTQDPFPMSSIVLWLTDSTKPALLINTLWTRIYIIFIIYIKSTNLHLNKADLCLECHQGYCSYPFHAQRYIPPIILPILFWLTSST